MTIEIIVPELGESVTEATVAKWFKAPGEAVARDELLVELETDKVNLEITAEVAGVLAEVVVAEGEDTEVGAVLGRIAEGEAAPAAAPEPEAAPAAAEPPPAPAEPAPAPGGGGMALSPAVRTLIEQHDLDPARITGTGKDGRLVKGDVLAAIEAKQSAPAAAAPEPAPAPAPVPAPVPAPAAAAAPVGGERREPMSRLRRRIAERLKQAQDTAAMLTTFNEVDMGAVMALRAQYRDGFEKKYGVRLGFMSFFVKAAVSALEAQPGVNAEIDGTDIIYRDYCNIGIAVGAPQGLVVPVLRDAGRMSFADVELAIGGYGRKARDGKLTIDDMTGGTFTITNGGVFGSLLSTPILNAPQSAILGMHKIQPRPMAIGDEVVVRPMMYLALSYDHRLVDGREAVTFLVRIKECIEDPQRIMLEV
ncbi:MAG: 2-oxoglutarate dehydrogenase complex dihydrolipoyllysine-residue succinyltransferase [Alphaproteobacteria bacterium]|jgi:2-oxoglutarate dehydrogenase E2 component (dihydrolipoamide succinyltransferase)|nr:2-oxoglutarate dehydrogenase complex dihydrolipoyllysine-residue succinyltransferase [Alphaproteobacteria bacterium]MDP6516647.1 2-oxoglutarate dehydrogenase complex dihydrolipoyllysine-residue succinyltransferase [Alphaproteobacteria bacterium]